MKISIYLFFLLFIFSGNSLFSQESEKYEIVTIAFYNLENLFDTENDPFTFDDDRTPEGKDHWTEKQYRDKLKKMAYAIQDIGKDLAKFPPVLVGVSEIENRKVLEDLVKTPPLDQYDYDIIHYDSPDRRGIDVALLYRKDHFVPINSNSHRLLIKEPKPPHERVFTRDQLVVTGYLLGEKMHFIVNHWPSRYGGVSASSYKRELAADLNLKIIDSLQAKDPYSKIISMGDFNDDYFDRSLKEILKARSNPENVPFQGLFNPMARLAKKGLGSSAYRDSWNLFDQIIISEPFLQGDYSTFQFYRAGIFNENYLITPSGRYKGYPFRSFGHSGYTGGYSDHFPVYIHLIREAPSSSLKGGE